MHLDQLGRFSSDLYACIFASLISQPCTAVLYQGPFSLQQATVQLLLHVHVQLGSIISAPCLLSSFACMHGTSCVSTELSVSARLLKLPRLPAAGPGGAVRVLPHPAGPGDQCSGAEHHRSQLGPSSSEWQQPHVPGGQQGHV